jgi:hypothetical protein
MKAKTIKGKTANEIKLELESNMNDGYKPTLAIIFTAEENELDAIRNLFTEKKIQIFGASTGTNFTDGEVDHDSILIMLLDMSPEYFRIEIRGAESGSTKNKAEQIGAAAKAAFSKPAMLIMSGGLTADGDEIIEGIESSCGKGTTLFGGLAADKLKMERTFVFTNDMVTDLGLVALIVDEEKILLKGVAVGGWKPVGIERTITKSNANLVHTIDNEPALDFIKRYAGLKEIDLANAINFVLASNFQLQLLRDGKHPVMRTPMWVNREDGSIVFAGALPEGSKVRLTLLPGFEVVDAAISVFEKYKEDQPDVDALILFSCAGRQLSLGPYANEEIDRIKKIWDAPLAGFFCYGEIGRVESGNHEFHNMTCSLALLKEK